MILEEFLATGEAVAAALADPAVAGAWDDDSALEGYSVGGLAGHLARGVLTVERYLERGAGAGGHLTDAAGYLVTVLGSADPVDSDLHRRVRQRGAETSQDGPEALAADVRETLDRLTDRLDEAALALPVQVLDGVTLPLGEYLRTRLVELVVHLDDLAASVGHDGPQGIPAGAYRAVAGLLGEVAAGRAGALPTIRSLARRERHPDAVRAL